MRLAAALLPLLATAGLQGCASTPLEWVRPSTTPEQARFDEQQCRNAAWLHVNSYAWSRPWSPWAPWSPWSPGFPAWRGYWGGPWGPDPFFEQPRLTDFCMRVRGYQLVERRRPAQEEQSSGTGSSATTRAEQDDEGEGAGSPTTARPEQDDSGEGSCAVSARGLGRRRARLGLVSGLERIEKRDQANEDEAGEGSTYRKPEHVGKRVSDCGSSRSNKSNS